jgi:hypothetical protein
MNHIQASDRAGWLGIALAAQRDTLSKILFRLKEIGVRAGTSLGLHRKFMQLMEQIAYDRQKELDLINEIESVEKHHLEMKQNNKLRRAGDKPVQTTAFTKKQEDKEPKRASLLTILGILWLFSAKPINHKKQELTVD